MRNVNRQQAQPLNVPRTRRAHALSVLTSLPAGKSVPIAAVPLLREDGMNASLRIQCEMLETHELLVNRVNLRVSAYLVPLLALERFEGSRDQFDRSYMGEAQVEGGSVVPFIETDPYGVHGANLVYKYLGVHGGETDEKNTAYLEAYNLIYNFRAKNRSENLTPRARLATDLAPAFWGQSRFQHILPSFDQAVLDGEVALTLSQSKLGVRGIIAADPVWSGGTGVYNQSGNAYSGGGSGYYHLVGGKTPSAPPDDDWAVYAEFGDGDITVSLSKLEQAKKAQWFARMRERYAGHDDEWIIDMLMQGLTIPDQHLKKPMLLADQTVPFAQAKRYATDAANLAESATSGGAVLDLRLRCPRVNTGGIVMLIAEAVPEQLFERQGDPFFDLQADTWRDNVPEFDRDDLDEQKVDRVLNGAIDTDHSAPTDTFGYEPMNGRWTRWGPRIGGKFYRPTTGTTNDEERQRIWGVETVDPSLSSDFYIVSSIHTKPFLDTVADPFELTVAGGAVIEGNTVFGGLLVEDTGSYDAVMAEAPTEAEQIDQTP